MNFRFRQKPIHQNTTPPIYVGDYEDQLDSVDDDDMLPAPDGSGLGVEYDWEFIEANQPGSIQIYE